MRQNDAVLRQNGLELILYKKQIDIKIQITCCDAMTQ